MMKLCQLEDKIYASSGDIDNNKMWRGVRFEDHPCEALLVELMDSRAVDKPTNLGEYSCRI